MAIDVGSYDPLGESTSEHLWSELAELRGLPVSRTELYGGLWMLTRYEDVRDAFRDWQTFCSSRGASPVPNAASEVRMLPIETDPPVQREFRRLIDRHFAPKTLAAKDAERQVREIAVSLMDRFVSRGQCDFVADFAERYPAQAFFQFAFGVGPEETAKVMHWLDQTLRRPHEAAEARRSFLAWTRTMLDLRRNGEGRDDVLGSLLTGTVEGRELTDSERMRALMNIITGGIETTIQVLGNIVYHLASQPTLRRRLQEEPELLEPAIEEFLRYEAPAPGNGRAATCPVQVGEAQIGEGDRVILYAASANRDPEAYDEPDEIRLDRFVAGATPHLTFGLGPHRCPGSHFARLELRVAVQEVLRRMPDLRLATEDIKYRSGITRGPVSLPVLFTATEA